MTRSLTALLFAVLLLLGAVYFAFLNSKPEGG